MGNHWEKNFDRSYLSKEGRYRILTCRYGYKVTNRTISSKICLCTLIVMSCIHTCKLEVRIFFLHWDMINQKFCPIGCPYKFYASPPTIVSIADKVHCVLLLEACVVCMCVNKCQTAVHVLLMGVVQMGLQVPTPLPCSHFISFHFIWLFILSSQHSWWAQEKNKVHSHHTILQYN